MEFEYIDVTLYSDEHGHQTVRLEVEAGMPAPAAFRKASRTLRKRGMTNCVWQVVGFRREPVDADDLGEDDFPAGLKDRPAIQL